MAQLNLPTSVFVLLTFIFPALAISTDIQAFADDKRVAVFINDEYSKKHKCVYFSNTENSLPFNEARVSRVTSVELEKVLTNCTRLRLSSHEDRRRMKRFIYPGTKWCGMGTRATSYADLGERRELDKCCRDHDHCETIIPPFAERYGILNPYPITRSHCECDRKFKDCLQTQISQGNIPARIVSAIYFLVLDLKCIEEKYELVCGKRSVYICTAYQLQYRMMNSHP